MDGRVAAVFGISGVGKTRLISRFVTANPLFIHLQASVLIKGALGASTLTSESLRAAGTHDMAANQAALVTEFAKARMGAPDRHFVFDGHSIIDRDTTLFIVPTDVIRNLRPDQLLFLQDDPEVIALRRAKDIQRQRPIRTAEALAEQQAIALQTCQAYAIELGIDLDVVSAGDEKNFSRCILSLASGAER